MQLFIDSNTEATITKKEDDEEDFFAECNNDNLDAFTAVTTTNNVTNNNYGSFGVEPKQPAASAKQVGRLWESVSVAFLSFYKSYFSL